MKPNLHIHVAGKKISSFHVFGTMGYISGVSLGIFLTWFTGLSVPIIMLLAVIGAGILFGFTYLFKIITGRENIVYYHHEIGIMLTCWFILFFLDLPILPYLDIVLLGIGTFLAFGRWGCYSVGCCHGRPGSHGVIYSQAHAMAGFPKYYVGVRMFPIQLVESFWVGIVVCTGTYLVLHGVRPGTIVVVYTIIYGAARFFFEFFRGDADRPYIHGFSEAQWTTLVLVTTSIIMSYLSWLPYYSWHPWVGLVLVLTMIGIYFYQKFQSVSAYQLALPAHIHDMALGLQKLDRHVIHKETDPNTIIPFVRTRMGMIISKGQQIEGGDALYHYTISSSDPNWTLNQKAVQRLAKYVGALRHQHLTYRVRKSNSDIYHLLFYQPTPEKNRQLKMAKINV